MCETASPKTVPKNELLAHQPGTQSDITTHTLCWADNSTLLSWQFKAAGAIERSRSLASKVALMIEGSAKLVLSPQEPGHHDSRVLTHLHPDIGFCDSHLTGRPMQVASGTLGGQAAVAARWRFVSAARSACRRCSAMARPPDLSHAATAPLCCPAQAQVTFESCYHDNNIAKPPPKLLSPPYAHPADSSGAAAPILHRPGAALDVCRIFPVALCPWSEQI